MILMDKGCNGTLHDLLNVYKKVKLGCCACSNITVIMD